VKVVGYSLDIQMVWKTLNIHVALETRTCSPAANISYFNIESTAKVDQKTIDIKMNEKRSILIWKLMAKLNINNHIFK